MEFDNFYMGRFLDDEYKNHDILDELLLISKDNPVVKSVLDYYRQVAHDSGRQGYKYLLTNLNEIQFTISKSLINQNADLTYSLKKLHEQSNKPIFFEGNSK